MNLVHHLLVAEALRSRLLWPARLRGRMLLGAIAPDAHTEVPGLGRGILHPTTDVVEKIIDLSGPHNGRRCGWRAFVVSVIAHIVADQLTRPYPYHLPPHAPTGFVAVSGPGPDVIDIGPITRSLLRQRSDYALGPLQPDAIDRKRWELLGRWPLNKGEGLYQVVEPLATVVNECGAEALTRMYRSDAGAALLGSWRA